jgi:hypothetical protein
MLERGEEGVHFGEGGALDSLQLSHHMRAVRKGPLER